MLYVSIKFLNLKHPFPWNTYNVRVVKIWHQLSLNGYMKTYFSISLSKVENSSAIQKQNMVQENVFYLCPVRCHRVFLVEVLLKLWQLGHVPWRLWKVCSKAWAFIRTASTSVATTTTITWSKISASKSDTIIFLKTQWETNIAVNKMSFSHSPDWNKTAH